MPQGPTSSSASVRSVGGLSKSPALPTSHCPDVFIRRSDIHASLEAYERLLGASKAYTSTMLAMSKASSDLAQALEDCSHVKGAHTCGTSFQAACGLHYLKSNYEQVLCDTFWKEFSIPLLSQLDVYRSTVHERQMFHEKAITEKSRLLKEIESKYQKEGKRRDRDLNTFRLMLTELQEKLNEIEDIKAQHYTDALEYEEQTWEYLASKVALLVRSQTEIAERLTSKASSDPLLESIVASIPDPFNTYGPPKREDELFTILQPSSTTNQGLRVLSEDAASPPSSTHRTSTHETTGAHDAHSPSHKENVCKDKRGPHHALFTPPFKAHADVSEERQTPARAFLTSQLHTQPSCGSLFGYGTGTDVRRSKSDEPEDVSDALHTQLRLEEPAREPSPPTPPASLSPTQHWAGERGVWE